ncbi:MAG: Crp/Fnr family transcriptional regulator [Gemmataceae bacterium]|nr:Crp/Fnr family transcriptional regulator [Gemmataceae bacterium]
MTTYQPLRPPVDGRPVVENRLLAALPGKEFDRLEARMTTVPFGIRDPVYRAGGPVDHVYFPLDGVLSQVVVMEDGGAVEVGTVGYEGMVGASVAFGDPRSQCQVFCQVAGRGRRLPADEFRAECDRGGPLAGLVRRYMLFQAAVAAQGVGCNRLHGIDERCARWLLMTHDRVGTETFTLTQEFLAQMLGVRRASVTVAAGMLQQAGIIRYTRGKITVLDRDRLEAASCECYRAVRAEYDRLLPPGEVG